VISSSVNLFDILAVRGLPERDSERVGSFFSSTGMIMKLIGGGFFQDFFQSENRFSIECK